MSKLKNLFSGLKNHFAKLRQDLNTMTFPEKLDHIWTYYKEYMFVAVMLCMILVAVIMAIANRDVQYYSCGVMSNVELSIEGHDYLTDVFYKEVLGNPEGKTYLGTSTLPTEEYTITDTSESYQTYMNVIAQVEGKDLDYMLMDEYSFGFYVEDRIYMDLSQLLDKQELTQLYEANLIANVREENEETGTPMGIDISQLDFGRDCLNTEGKTYLVFIRNTEQPENCLKLWEHIKSWKTED